MTADADRQAAAYHARDTDAAGWFTKDEMRSLRLHPGFRAWAETHLGM